MDEVVMIILGLVVAKSLIIGSDFNIHKWIINRKEYMKQYDDWQKMKP
jgi:uncharacterized protein YxeA